MSVATTAPIAATGRPWRRAAMWLVLLGPFFFASYGFATWAATQRAEVGVVVFAWERHIPLLPWTIIPYWSIDVLYAISLFVCTTPAELDRHARRLLTAQLVAVTCFILFPLRFSFARPELDGVPGALFAVLASFDKPFNQAPSLHIALLVILWDCYARHVPRGLPPRVTRWAGWLMHGWFALIGLSVLTTFQHHFVDIPTGALLGFFCLWLWPDGVSPLARPRLTHEPKRWKLALYYGLGAGLFAAMAAAFGGFGLWLFWPAVSLGLVAAIYGAIGTPGFQKGRDGRLSLAATWLLAPYLLGAWINTKLWKGDGRPNALLRDGVSVGRIPSKAAGFAAIVDVCAELPGARAGSYAALPMLDLVTPSPARLREAADAIEQARRHGTVLVCCALGYSRSAAAAATWLVVTGRAVDAASAVAQVRGVRPHLVLDAAAQSAVAAAADLP